MGAQQRNITLGTAGHIDHGKTALIRLLTGCETDRLKEEKERGMSIELGFAPCLISGTEIGVVDVPGHENFVKTMVAGATGIDGAILVIAADDGVMPQTREHLDILTLLGVEHGIVALTKVDCVRPERVEAVTQEIAAFLLGTFLEGAPVLPVSSITGDGFGEFYDALKALVEAIEPKRADGVFRVPLERAFSAKGYGTIVAGIPVSGSIKIGDELVLLPQGRKGRLRAVQVYNHESDGAMVGQCAALNVPQWDPKDIKRGNVVTIGDYFSPESWYVCELKLLAQEKSSLKNGAQVKFHTGTSETPASAYLFEDAPLKPGETCLIQVCLNQPVVAGPGDHFILRLPSPARTIGGGLIVEAIPRRLKRSRPEILDDIRARAEAVKTPRDFIAYCVRTAESLAVDERQISLRTKIPEPEVTKTLAGLQDEDSAIRLGARLYAHTDTVRRIEQRLLELVAETHRRQPESPGIRPEQLLTASGIHRSVFDPVLERLLSNGLLAERKNHLALPQHREQFKQAEWELLTKIEALFKQQPFSPPGSAELMAGTGASEPEIRKALRILVEQQRIVRIEQDMYVHAEALADARARLIAYIREHGNLESVKFKYLLDTTRKYAIPLLDYFDKIGVTRRVGYTRHLNKVNADE
ncbi:MAG: selenocysteine-specific translation elongation factor [Sedimentisphaerales bacterium]|nr:selenocysteine-specific translation elongation factor [Sedimentisphaerales bacterium]